MTIMLDKNHSFSQGKSQVPDLTKGGQMGAMMVPNEIEWMAGYGKNRIIPVLQSAPGLLQYLDNSKEVIATMKNLLENQFMRIDGLNGTHEWEYDSKNIHMSGETFDTPVRGSVSKSEVSYTWAARKNAAVVRFWTRLGRLLIMDPYLGAPGIISHPNYIRAGSPEIQPSDRSFTMLFVEPNDSMTEPVFTWQITNMQQRTGGEIVGRSEAHYTQEVPEVNIGFVGTAMPMGITVDKLGKEYLSSLNISGLRPTEVKPFRNGIASDVEAAAGGFRKKIDEALK